MNLEIQERNVSGVTVLDLSGRIVLGEENTSLRETLKALAEKGKRRILLNLADVNYIDSSGLSTLMAGLPARPGQRGRLKLFNLTRKTRYLLQATRLLTVLEVYEDQDDAIRSFPQEEHPKMIVQRLPSNGARLNPYARGQTAQPRGSLIPQEFFQFLFRNGPLADQPPGGNG